MYEYRVSCDSTPYIFICTPHKYHRHCKAVLLDVHTRGLTQTVAHTTVYLDRSGLDMCVPVNVCVCVCMCVRILFFIMFMHIAAHIYAPQYRLMRSYKPTRV
jgi:hypothetical protein